VTTTMRQDITYTSFSLFVSLYVAEAAASTYYFYSLYRETGAFRRSAYSWRIVGPLKCSFLLPSSSLSFLSLPLAIRPPH
jgi:hypothetical protein